MKKAKKQKVVATVANSTLTNEQVLVPETNNLPPSSINVVEFGTCKGVYANHTIYSTNLSRTKSYHLNNKVSQEEMPNTQLNTCPRITYLQGKLYVPSAEHDGSTLTQLYEYNLQTQKWTCIKAPNAPVSCANNSIFTRQDTICVFGGYRNQYLNTMFAYNFTAWNEITYGNNAPSGRCAFAYDYNKYTDAFWVHGGTTTGGDRLNDLWCFTFATRMWQQVEQLGKIPEGTCLHWMCFHGKDRLFLFGGNTSAQTEIKEYQVDTKTWKRHLQTQLSTSVPEYCILSDEQEHIHVIEPNRLLSFYVGPARGKKNDFEKKLLQLQHNNAFTNMTFQFWY